MVLLDEKITTIEVVHSSGLGIIDEENEESHFSFTDKESINLFENAIRQAVKQKGSVDVDKPDFDIFVKYEDGLPAHALHLWLGKESEKSMFMYIIDEENTVYLTSEAMSDKLRELLKGQTKAD